MIHEAQPAPEDVRPEEALPALRDVLEKPPSGDGRRRGADELAGWVREESPNFDWKRYGFQESATSHELRAG